MYSVKELLLYVILLLKYCIKMYTKFECLIILYICWLREPDFEPFVTVIVVVVLVVMVVVVVVIVVVVVEVVVVVVVVVVVQNK